MKKPEQDLLIMTNEACAELSKEISSAMRFELKGLELEDFDSCDFANLTNGERIQLKYAKLQALMELLIEQKILTPLSEEKQTMVKKLRKSEARKWQEHLTEIAKEKEAVDKISGTESDICESCNENFDAGEK